MNKNEISQVLRAAAKVIAARPQESMGVLREGEESPWPEVKGWDIMDFDDENAFGDYKSAIYQHAGKYTGLFAYVDVKPLEKGGMGTVTLKSYGQEKVFKMKHEKFLTKYLTVAAPKWAEQEEKNLKSTIEGLGGPAWDVSYNHDNARAEYRGKKNEFSGAELYVDFDDVADSLNGGTYSNQASIQYIKDRDYHGTVGEHEVKLKYSSIQDMQKILKKAEAIFKKKEGL